ncbi:L,D-transpeptidase [Streptomyces sp. IMTB 2501]|uniref:L,D-transpeptidase family protein n=1 Tax=Streptomyces sp. IMTB 2501 TaxID=1776340 RepID=UPI00117C076A|nr:L,D-transpeptidase [Streptomyces sp. IMTB 2501]
MSDDLNTDELTATLRELATANETSPPVAASEIRRRGARRGRRRRTALTLGAGTAALALAAFALTLNTGDAPEHRQAPAATAPRLPSPSPSSPSPSPPGPAPTPVIGTVNFEKQTLTIDGRVMPITSGFPTLVTAHPLTVSAKLDLTRDPVGPLAKGACKAREPYVVELHDTDGTSIYAGSLACAPRTGGWIGLGTKDAVWLYNRLTPGDTLSAITPRVSDGP